jgi:hypothetical protein
MVHPPADTVLLASVALGSLVVVSRLLLLWSLPLSSVVKLAWSVLDILRATVGIMSRITTLEASISSSGRRVVVPHRRASGSVLAVLWDIGALH